MSDRFLRAIAQGLVTEYNINGRIVHTTIDGGSRDVIVSVSPVKMLTQLLTVLLLLVVVDKAVGCGFGGGGGGGGGCPPPCCCPPPPPPPPPCGGGCGRRRRREAKLALTADNGSAVAVSGEQATSEVSRVTSDDTKTCNSVALSRIIVKNLRDDLNASRVAIHNALHAELGGYFVVACTAAQPQPHFSADSPQFCSGGTAQFKCYVFQIY